MNKFNLALLLIITFFATTLLAQKSKKHTNYYKQADGIAIKSKSYSIDFDNVVAKTSYLKMAIEIHNLTTDFLLIKKEEVTFDVEGESYKPASKWLFIRPNKGIKRTFKIEGKRKNYLVSEFEVMPHAIYLVKAEGKVQQAPNFELPAAQNEIKMGDFVVKLKTSKLKTKKTVAFFEVTYNGDAIGLVDMSKVGVVVPEKGNKEFANKNTSNVKLFKKGDSKLMKVLFQIPASHADMQFANMEILWRDAFQTSIPDKLTGISASFVVDQALTKAKN